MAGKPSITMNKECYKNKATMGKNVSKVGHIIDATRICIKLPFFVVFISIKHF